MLSEQNLAWKTFDQNKSEFVPVLGNLASDGSDHQAVVVAFALAAAAALLALVTGRETKEGPIARWRIVGLTALAFVLYFALPFDIRGYMYDLNTRYAHLAAALLVSCVPVLKPEWTKRATWVAAAAALVMAVPLVRTFRSFADEAHALDAIVEATSPKPRVMGLIFNAGSRFVSHPVYLHASTVLARERGGLTNFSFALTPHSPVMYQHDPPPTFPSEWRPDQMNWQTQGRFYDHFLVRGVHPSRLFGPLMDSELTLAGQSGDFFLVKKR
jgi:hypothetical protein